MAEGYKGHKPGSRKEQVHKVYDEAGLEKAVALASELGLSPTTARSWIATWGKPNRKPDGSQQEAAKPLSAFDTDAFTRKVFKNADAFVVFKEAKGKKKRERHAFETFAKAVAFAKKHKSTTVWPLAGRTSVMLLEKDWPEYLKSKQG